MSNEEKKIIINNWERLKTTNKVEIVNTRENIYNEKKHNALIHTRQTMWNQFSCNLNGFLLQLDIKMEREETKFEKKMLRYRNYKDICRAEQIIYLTRDYALHFLFSSLHLGLLCSTGIKNTNDWVEWHIDFQIDFFLFIFRTLMLLCVSYLQMQNNGERKTLCTRSCRSPLSTESSLNLMFLCTKTFVPIWPPEINQKTLFILARLNLFSWLLSFLILPKQSLILPTSEMLLLDIFFLRFQEKPQKDKLLNIFTAVLFWLNMILPCMEKTKTSETIILLATDNRNSLAAFASNFHCFPFFRLTWVVWRPRITYFYTMLALIITSN